MANGPGPPKLIRRERLLDLPCAADPLLEVVDCDHRLRFPTPSLTPLTLFDGLCVLGGRLDSGGVTGLEKFATPFCVFEDIWAARDKVEGRGSDRLGPTEAALWTVTVEEDKEEEEVFFA
jgi:hypothetical protein